MVRRALLHAMRILGRQFVSGHTIEEALGRAKQARAAASFDMLGEAAHTANDAERYFAACETAITTLGRSTSGAEHTGFGVRVYPSGRKSYIVNYRAGDGGRKAPNKRVMLGRCDPPPERRLEPPHLGQLRPLHRRVRDGCKADGPRGEVFVRRS